MSINNVLLQPAGALPHLMKQVLNRLRTYETLSREEAKEVLLAINAGYVNEHQVTAFMSVYMMRRPSIAELSGFRDALLEQGVVPGLEAVEAIDIVGTGGDGKNTFNISTLSAIVVAGAGYKVIKHGNHGATSVSGSSDVLEYLGYRFTTEARVLNRQLETANITFLHAPLFHPAMKRVAHIRRNLGVRTFFNLLGPVSNPAQPGFLLLGANSLPVARMYHYLLQDAGQEYRVVYSLDGYDELSLTGEAKLLGPATDRILSPADFGYAAIAPQELEAGDGVQQAATIFKAVLDNTATRAQQQVVIANSALAIQCRSGLPLADCMAQAEESLRSGKALSVFQQLLKTTLL
ncbi:anthranilate phosphoribosyltransferase [Taibaiella chishuiensis]|uniref:Anthranilate phosphoribosyltransferase n=1 Tax=Taibaiella chishuiensis TaxID=1434707 RepID=A0A2P8D5Q2_9BACT|nr:anthranilate phosphoribosyltransferase [Taibaiella chishuiensis]PSK92555.1 anthranilate phosphoribosyltransferase [Taibaiella chishuiensis]